MATIINTPGGTGDNGEGFSSGLIIGIIVVIILIILFFVMGSNKNDVPDADQPNTVNVTVPNNDNDNPIVPNVIENNTTNTTNSTTTINATTTR